MTLQDVDVNEQFDDEPGELSPLLQQVESSLLADWVKDQNYQSQGESYFKDSLFDQLGSVRGYRYDELLELQRRLDQVVYFFPDKLESVLQEIVEVLHYSGKEEDSGIFSKAAALLAPFDEERAKVIDILHHAQIVCTADFFATYLQYEDTYDFTFELLRTTLQSRQSTLEYEDKFKMLTLLVGAEQHYSQAASLTVESLQELMEMPVTLIKEEHVKAMRIGVDLLIATPQLQEVSADVKKYLSSLIVNRFNEGDLFKAQVAVEVLQSIPESQAEMEALIEPLVARLKKINWPEVGYFGYNDRKFEILKIFANYPSFRKQVSELSQLFRQGEEESGLSRSLLLVNLIAPYEGLSDEVGTVIEQSVLRREPMTLLVCQDALKVETDPEARAWLKEMVVKGLPYELKDIAPYVRGQGPYRLGYLLGELYEDEHYREVAISYIFHLLKVLSTDKVNGNKPVSHVLVDFVQASPTPERYRLFADFVRVHPTLFPTKPGVSEQLLEMLADDQKLIQDILLKLHRHQLLDEGVTDQLWCSKMLAEKLQTPETALSADDAAAARLRIIAAEFTKQPFPTPEVIMAVVSGMSHQEQVSALQLITDETSQIYLTLLMTLVNEATDTPEVVEKQLKLLQKMNAIFQGQLTAENVGAQFAMNQLTKIMLQRYASSKASVEVKDKLIRLALNTAERKDPSTPLDRRLMAELLKMDHERLGEMVANYLSRPDVPARSFIYFAHKLIEAKFFPTELSQYLDREMLPFWKEILTLYGSAFKQVAVSISELASERIIDPLDREDQLLIFQALQDLGSFGPRLFALYKVTEDKDNFVSDINHLKSNLFKNTSVFDMAREWDFDGDTRTEDMIIEMVLAAYQPHNGSDKWVKNILRKVDDDVITHLDRFTIPDEGYAVQLTTVEMQLKPGKQTELTMSERALQRPREVLLFTEYIEFIQKKDQEIKTLANRLAYASNDERPALGKALEEQKLALFTRAYSMMIGMELMPDLTHLSRYQQLYNLQRFIGTLSSEKGQDSIYRQGIDFADNFEDYLKVYVDSLEEIADVKAILLAYFKTEAEKIQRELKKYQAQEGVNESTAPYVCYMTKTPQSFLARSRMRLCTDEDVDRYNEPDNWHLDMIDVHHNTLEGNVICYEMEDRPTLLMRQFNAINLLDNGLSPASFCLEMLRIGVQFAKDNNFTHVALPEQTSHHLLSNDNRMYLYLKNKILLPQHQVQLDNSFNVSYSPHLFAEKIYEFTVEELEQLLNR